MEKPINNITIEYDRSSCGFFRSCSLFYSLGSTPTLRWKSAGITVAGLSNAAGNASNQLNQPKAIALIDQNLLYIADCNNHRVQKYQLDSASGTTVAGEANGPGGVASNRLKNPSGILIDSSEGIFVSDSGNHRIQYWQTGASQGTTVAGSSTGEFYQKEKQTVCFFG